MIIVISLMGGNVSWSCCTILTYPLVEDLILWGLRWVEVLMVDLICACAHLFWLIIVDCHLIISIPFSMLIYSISKDCVNNDNMNDNNID